MPIAPGAVTETVHYGNVKAAATPACSDGDWLYAFVNTDHDQVAIEAPGWTRVIHDPDGGRCAVFKRYVASASEEPLTHTFDWNAPSWAVILIVAVSGCDPVDSFNAMAAPTSTSGTTHTSNGLTTTRDACYVLGFWGVDKHLEPDPANTVLVAEAAGNGEGAGAAIGGQAAVAAGAVGGVAATTTTEATGRALLVALQPPSVSPEPEPPEVPDPHDGPADGLWPTFHAGQGRHSGAWASGLPESHTEEWKCARLGSHYAFTAQPVIGQDGTIWAMEWVGVGDAGNLLHAIDPSDGSKRFSRVISGVTTNAVGLSCDGRGNIYFCGPGGLYCYDNAGSLQWFFPVPATHTAGNRAPVIDADGNLYFLATRTVGSVSRVYAVDSDGALLWATDLTKMARSGLAYEAASDALYVVEALSNGYTPQLDQIDRATGDLTDTYDLTDPAENLFGCDLSARAGRLYVAAAFGTFNTFRAFDVEAGSVGLAWTWAYTGAYAAGGISYVPPGVDADGTIYAAGWASVEGVWRCAVFAIDAGGNLLWEHVIDSEGGGASGYRTVTVAADCVAAVVPLLGASYIDFLSKEDGALLDTLPFPDLYPGNVEACQMAVGDGAIYIPGSTFLWAYATGEAPPEPDPPLSVALDDALQLAEGTLSATLSEEGEQPAVEITLTDTLGLSDDVDGPGGAEEPALSASATWLVYDLKTGRWLGPWEGYPAACALYANRVATPGTYCGHPVTEGAGSLYRVFTGRDDDGAGISWEWWSRELHDDQRKSIERLRVRLREGGAGANTLHLHVRVNGNTSDDASREMALPSPPGVPDVTLPPWRPPLIADVGSYRVGMSGASTGELRILALGVEETDRGSLA
jgi:hypothetical protein